jgi:hypothetical protein
MGVAGRNPGDVADAMGDRGLPGRVVTQQTGVP